MPQQTPNAIDLLLSHGYCLAEDEHEREVMMPFPPLGLLYRPKYFYGGVAIHGFTSVPSQPASHGCVRLTYPAMDMIWEKGHVPPSTTVLVYDG